MPGLQHTASRLKVLLVEDDEDDFLLTDEVLSEISEYQIDLTWIETYDLGLSYLTQGEADICLVDYRIGARTGLDFVEAAKVRKIQCPIILLTGVGHHDIDVAATEVGAADFMEKSALTPALVERSFRYALANAKAMQVLAERTSLLETTLENTGAGIAALDDQGKIVASNQLFHEMTEQLTARNRADPSGDVSDDALVMLLDKIEGQPNGLEVETEASRVFQVFRKRASKGGSVVSITDISAQKSLQRNMLRAKADAEAASRSKSSFLANVSHELRTPLNGIIGFSDLIITNHKSVDVVDCAVQINESGKHLLDIINAVLDYSKLESGQRALDEDDIYDLDLVAKFAIRQVQPQTEKRNIQVQLHIDENLAGIRGDEMSFRQILINLVSNAVRFSHDGGVVDVSLSVDGGNSAVLSVTDHGIGMDTGRVAEAFIPFQQLHDSLDRQYEGTGLGLSIVQSLAHLHNGMAEIESALGKGTTVRIILPAERVIQRRCIGDAPAAMACN